MHRNTKVFIKNGDLDSLSIFPAESITANDVEFAIYKRELSLHVIENCPVTHPLLPYYMKKFGTQSQICSLVLSRFISFQRYTFYKRRLLLAKAFWELSLHLPPELLAYISSFDRAWYVCDTKYGLSSYGL